MPLYVGDTYTFSIMDVYTCRYQISRDNGSTWTTIAEDVAAVVANEGEDNETVTNSYEWTITGPVATQCLIKFVDQDDDAEYIGAEVFEIMLTVTFGGKKKKTKLHRLIYA
ncbi:MAG: hypothetical protein KKD77_24175 [Gammaproteobacteria bacterium]|nr:hypothetical protein [Gammaproteobacteria bacterium]